MAIDIKLLDCTLRDGGYINDWEFEHNNIINIFERLTLGGTDIVEVGFIDDRRPFDINRTIMPDTKSIDSIFNIVKKRPGMVVGMIDYGTCDIKNIEPCENSFLDGIRVIFKKHRMVEAMEYCRALKNLGYKVFSQLVSITSYSDEELVELTKIANDVKPYAVSIVDTYGLLHPTSLLHYYKILEENLSKDISIGFHAHNNLQLAFANTVTFIDQAINYDTRDVVVDGTLFGMGKSAGNAPLELIAPYLNSINNKNYNVNQFLEVIEECIKEINALFSWGYKSQFYMSAEKKCHPNYISYFENKGNLSVTGLNTILEMMPQDDKKLLFDKDYAEELYQSFIKSYIDDEKSFSELKSIIANRKCLLIGPGKNIKLQSQRINDFIADNSDLVIISVNYIPSDFDVNYLFVTKQYRFKQMSKKLHVKNLDAVIATSNVDVINSDNVIKFSRDKLLDLKEDIVDNPLFMLLKILRKLGVNYVALAGFDGYSDKEDNYLDSGMEYGFIKNMARNLNRKIYYELKENYNDFEIEFITYSHYTNVDDSNSATF